MDARKFSLRPDSTQNSGTGGQNMKRVLGASLEELAVPNTTPQLKDASVAVIIVLRNAVPTTKDK